MKTSYNSDIGLCRSENQDIVICESIGDSVFIVLCDGMGGENFGKDASNMVSEVVRSKFLSGYSPGFSSNSIRNLLISTVTQANSVVFNTASSDPEKMGMGSTCVAAFIDAATDTAHIVNVGDSRAYICQRDNIRQITRDHSFVQMLIDQGKITEEEKEGHPRKNMLIRAVGVEKDIEVDYFEEFLNGGKILMCSDGLHGFCKSDEILEIMNSSSTEATADLLIEMAIEHGGHDNISVAVAENTIDETNKDQECLTNEQ